MSEWRSEIENALKDFVVVGEYAGIKVELSDFRVEYLEAAHKPPTALPKDYIAAYGFWYSGEWLKIGIVGPNSNARYISQHYSPNSANSTLAKSLLNDAAIMSQPDFDQKLIGDWIKGNTHRVNILLNAAYGMTLLRLLEAFLHVRLKPRYER